MDVKTEDITKHLELKLKNDYVSKDANHDSGHGSERQSSESEDEVFENSEELNIKDLEEVTKNKTKEIDKVEDYKIEIVWFNVGFWIVFHALFLYSLTFLPGLSIKMWVFLVLTAQLAGSGITAGAHRLWAHKSYQVKLPFKILLLIGNSMAGQNSIYIWSRDHRTHHKCSETFGDPHNAKQGFFFAHMGWLLVKKHPQVIKSGKTIDMSDLEADPLVMFQHRHYIPCMLITCFIIPTVLPYMMWNESLTTAYFVAVFRYLWVLHSTWLVNSAAHLFGEKPYDKSIGPAENGVVSVLAMGEGHHNYHHVFPFDYSTSEWGYSLNITKIYIDCMAWLGQAYNLRTTKPQTIAARASRTGVPELTAEWQKKKLA